MRYFFVHKKRSIKHKTISRFSSRCTFFYCILFSLKIHFGIVFLSLYPSHLSIGSLMQHFQVDAIKVLTMHFYLSLSFTMHSLTSFLLFSHIFKISFQQQLEVWTYKLHFRAVFEEIACKFPYTLEIAL